MWNEKFFKDGTIDSQWYVVVGCKLFAFSSEDKARECYNKAMSEYRDPFCTQDYCIACEVRDTSNDDTFERS